MTPLAFLADGKEQQEFPLPAKPILGGLSAASVRAFVTTEDGTVTCLGAAPAVGIR